MKKQLRTLLMLAVCAVFFGAATNAFAQNVPLVGGYNNAEATDQQVVNAANFAVKAQAKKQKTTIKLVAVNRAAKQVVAGMNFQICLNVETRDRKTKRNVPQTVQTVVYQDLKGKYKLTEWAIAACADAAPVAASN